MSQEKLVEPFVFASSHAELLDLAKNEVDTGRSLAAIMHNGFALEDCLVMPETVIRGFEYDRHTVKTDTKRSSLEWQGRNWLPLMNTAPDPFGQESRLLPPEIAWLALGLHNATSAKPIKDMPTFNCDEFRSHRSPGIVHTDGWHRREGLNMHLTALGEGVLFVIDPDPTFKAIKQADIYDRYRIPDDVEPPKKIGGTMFNTPLRAGSIAIVSSFGNRKTGRPPKPHRVSTTSKFRASVSVDQLRSTRRAIGSLPNRKARRLEEAGIDLSAYWEALADAV